MMTGHRTKITGVTIKDGKIIRRPRRQSVSEKIRQKKSKKVKVVRRTPDALKSLRSKLAEARSINSDLRAQLDQAWRK